MTKLLFVFIIPVCVLLAGCSPKNEGTQQNDNNTVGVSNEPVIESVQVKTYTNEKRGFTFSYPTTHEVTVDDEIETSIGISVRKIGDSEERKSSDIVCDECTFQISTIKSFVGQEDDTMKTPEERIEWSRNGALRNDPSAGLPYVETIIAERTGYTITPRGINDNLIHYRIFLKNKDNAYDVYNINIKNTDTAKKILESFQFINQ